MSRDIFKETLAEPRYIAGAPIPLFERLINDDVNEDREAPIKRYYNKFELIQSIQREIARILNTRANAKKRDHRELQNQSQNFALPQLYGLPDFSYYDATNSENNRKIAKLCEQAITQYEPRLNNVSVVITGFEKQSQTLSANIQASLNVPNFREELTFPITFQA